MTGLLAWGGSLHQTFRLLPQESQSGNLRPFLQADGLTPEQLLARLPYDRARSKSPKPLPDLKRYRDGKQIYQTVGLLYEHDGVVRVTELGAATHRWLDIITPRNRVVLARHAAYALAACQLRNPTGAGTKYAESIIVFPFAFIWRAMLSLDGCITSDELNRGIFKVQNEDQLAACVTAIRSARARNNIELLGEETISDEKKNDRIISWVAMASFGWTLFPDKGAQEAYRLDPITLSVVREAAMIRHRHKEFSTPHEYITHISNCAALPKDIR